MPKLRIEYSKETCIGQGSCAAIAPDYFEMLGKKATLKGSKDSGNEIFILEVDCDEETANSVIESGKGCPANAIKVIDIEKNSDLVTNDVTDEKAKEIIAEYDDANEFVLDNEGYFLIRLNRKENNIEVAFCKGKNNIIMKVKGEKPNAIYHTLLVNENLNIRKEHAAYLGRELQKAYLALENRLEYVQDDELDLDKKYKGE